MKSLLALLSILALTLAAPCALAESAEPIAPAASLSPAESAKTPTVICATGSASVALEADIAMLTLGVRASGATVSEAQKQYAGVLEALSSALEQIGVSHEDIYSSCYDVDTVYNYQYTKLSEKETPAGYSLASTLVVRVRDTARLGEVIDAAISCGAQSSYELSFESSSYDEAYNQALSQATADAVRKAGLLAQAAGLTLDELCSVTETGLTQQPSAADGSPAGPCAGLSATAMVEVRYTAHP